MVNTTEATMRGWELDEVILAGVEQCYPDVAERFRALIGFAEYLRRHRVFSASSALLDHIDREKCLQAGVCPECGEDATLTHSTEHHPYGEGTAAEHLQVYVCASCGEV